MSAIGIRPLTQADAAGFRALRLEGLRLAPDAFSAAYEDEVERGEAEFASRIPDAPPSAIFGAFRDGRLVALTGLAVRPGAKERHKGLIWGVYVAADARGLGLARRLLDTAIAHARTIEGLEILQLGVAVTNEPAKALYGAAGFEVFGIERKALRLAPGRYVDEELRMLELAVG
ncbi:MAG TPA: GNAT family N-acetyltransferase [Aliidongia sp.]|uniref:GNAT family N-acetyltransferase n=1 Tax=Aliidongia sp. TaxID=1914230 RepID=UPI002DDD4402|nr:GNAT family N-acetyltransferase [Aliidongia sp.]HEV2676726.1 GNAT family N-acetyltransferase [Aliidongia sp.]